MHRTIRNKAVGLALLALVIVSCDSNKLYEENIALDNNEWKTGDVKTFEFDIEDTLSPINLYVNFRTTTDYPYSNLYIFMYSKYPDGYEDKDTLEFIVAEPDGRWLGDNSGTVVENRILISQGGRFAKKGTYQFGIEHAMRDEVLPEIIDVGFRVELMEQN